MKARHCVWVRTLSFIGRFFQQESRFCGYTTPPRSQNNNFAKRKTNGAEPNCCSSKPLWTCQKTRLSTFYTKCFNKRDFTMAQTGWLTAWVTSPHTHIHTHTHIRNFRPIHTRYTWLKIIPLKHENWPPKTYKKVSWGHLMVFDHSFLTST